MLLEEFWFLRDSSNGSEEMQQQLVQKLKARLRCKGRNRSPSVSSKLTRTMSISTSGRSLSSSSWEFGSDVDVDDSSYEDNETGCEEALPPEDVPEGCLAVYVGKQELERFVVDAKHLKHPWFKALLDKSAEEFGFDYEGGITIPCDASLFQRMLWMLDSGDPAAEQLQITDLFKS